MHFGQNANVRIVVPGESEKYVDEMRKLYCG